jgi:hypothetical protein
LESAKDANNWSASLPVCAKGHDEAITAQELEFEAASAVDIDGMDVIVVPSATLKKSRNTTEVQRKIS